MDPEEFKKLDKTFSHYFKKEGPYILKKQCDWMLMISRKRVLAGFTVQKLDELDQYFTEEHDGIPYTEGGLFRSQEEQVGETQFWAFLLQIFCVDHRASSPALAVIREAFPASFSLFISKVLFCIESMWALKINQEQHENLQKHLVLQLFLLEHFDGDYPSFETFSEKSFQNSVDYEVIQEKFGQIYDLVIKDFPDIKVFMKKNVFIHRFSTEFYAYYFLGSTEIEPLRVGLALEHRDELQPCLHLWLNSIGNIQVEEFETANASKYDFVIYSSSTFLNDFPNTEGFQWEMDYSSEELLIIYRLIHKKYFAKLFN
jgi:hypothetical protein